MPKPKPLTAAQQEVVNLMAAGWELSFSPGMGRFSSDAAHFWSKDRNQCKNLAANVPEQLERKGVIERDPDNKDWRSRKYRLTDVGKSLAVEPQGVIESETWYCVSGELITPEKFLRSTAECLIKADGSKQAKHTNWQDYFATRAEAVEHIQGCLERDLKSARQRLASAERALADFIAREATNGD